MCRGFVAQRKSQHSDRVQFTSHKFSGRRGYHLFVRGGRDRGKEGRNFSPVDFLLLFVFPLLCLSRIIIQPTSSTFFSAAVEKVQILVKGLAVDDHRIFGCTLSGFLNFQEHNFHTFHTSLLFKIRFFASRTFPPKFSPFRWVHIQISSSGVAQQKLWKINFPTLSHSFPVFQLITRI